ncbi:MAG TPA: radical SAM protein [bacterium]|nr:radical SAM protein [bacterium]
MARVLFVQTEWFEHLGILSLAASARAAGHHAGLLLGRGLKSTVAEIVDAAPDVAAFSSSTGAHRAALAVARALRPWFHGLIIMGGPHPTFFPEVIAEPCLDAICRGEGEGPLIELLDRIDAGQDLSELPGFWIKQHGKVISKGQPGLAADLDSLPFPARDLLEKADPFFKNYSMRRVMAGRGCPHQCTYCFNRALREMVKGQGPYVRLRGVDNVMAELKNIAAHGRRTINFVDDTFGLKRSWTLELLERYRSEIALPFIVNLRPEQADAELVAALKTAGCYCAQVGVESANPRIRREVLGRDVEDEVLEGAAARIKQAGIRLLTYNMVGLPGESLADAAETFDWNARLKVDFPRISIFQPYPRTELGDRALRAEGAEPCLDAISESYFRSSPLKGREARRIENLHKLFWPYLRLPATRPLIRQLIRLPANPLYDLVFLASIGLQYRRAVNMTLPETLRLGLRNLGAYFS